MIKDLSDLLNMIVEPENRATMISDTKVIWASENIDYRNGFSSLNILKESIKTINVGQIIRSFSPFYEVLNEIVFNLMSGGILKYHRDTNEDPKNRRNMIISDKIEPQVLTMDHLGVGFLICVVSLSAAFIVLLIELLVARVERIVLFSIVKAYIRYNQVSDSIGKFEPNKVSNRAKSEKSNRAKSIIESSRQSEPSQDKSASQVESSRQNEPSQDKSACQVESSRKTGYK